MIPDDRNRADDEARTSSIKAASTVNERLPSNDYTIISILVPRRTVAAVPLSLSLSVWMWMCFGGRISSTIRVSFTISQHLVAYYPSMLRALSNKRSPHLFSLYIILRIWGFQTCCISTRLQKEISSLQMLKCYLESKKEEFKKKITWSKK